MKPYGLKRGNEAFSGNKTKSFRRIYKKKERAENKRNIYKEEVSYDIHGRYCECEECEPQNLYETKF